MQEWIGMNARMEWHFCVHEEGRVRNTLKNLLKFILRFEGCSKLINFVNIRKKTPKNLLISDQF